MSGIMSSKFGASPAPITSSEQLKKLRARTVHYLTPDVAAVAGVSLAQLIQFTAGAFHLDATQLEALARRVQFA